MRISDVAVVITVIVIGVVITIALVLHHVRARGARTEQSALRITRDGIDLSTGITKPDDLPAASPRADDPDESATGQRDAAQ